MMMRMCTSFYYPRIFSSVRTHQIIPYDQQTFNLRILSGQMRLRELSGRHHVEREMRTPVMVVIEKVIGVLLSQVKLISSEFLMTEFLAS